MKRIILILLVLFNFFSYGKELEQINNLTMIVSENIKLNKEIKKSKYKLQYIYPNFIRKDIFEPEFNKGEIYIYSGEKKIVYLPFFNQKTEEKIAEDENEVLKAINFILNKIRYDESFKKDYYSKKIKEIVLDSGNTIKIENLKKYDEYLLPTSFKIKDKDNEIGELKIESYQINLDISEEELSKI